MSLLIAEKSFMWNENENEKTDVRRGLAVFRCQKNAKKFSAFKIGVNHTTRKVRFQLIYYGLQNLFLKPVSVLYRFV